MTDVRTELSRLELPGGGGYYRSRIPCAEDSEIARAINAFTRVHAARAGRVPRGHRPLRAPALLQVWSERIAALAVRLDSPQPLVLGLVGLSLAQADDDHEALLVAPLHRRSAEKLGVDAGRIFDEAAGPHRPRRRALARRAARLRRPARGRGLRRGRRRRGLPLRARRRRPRPPLAQRLPSASSPRTSCTCAWRRPCGPVVVTAVIFTVTLPAGSPLRLTVALTFLALRPFRRTFVRPLTVTAIDLKVIPFGRRTWIANLRRLTHFLRAAGSANSCAPSSSPVGSAPPGRRRAAASAGAGRRRACAAGSAAGRRGGRRRGRRGRARRGRGGRGRVGVGVGDSTPVAVQRKPVDSARALERVVGAAAGLQGRRRTR